MLSPTLKVLRFLLAGLGACREPNCSFLCEMNKNVKKNKGRIKRGTKEKQFLKIRF
jgi:hypothetical protein